jgi:hypothetical protein
MRLLLLLACICTSFHLFGQTSTITGTLLDARDQTPLPGTTIQLIRLPDSVRTGTVTDAEGRFALTGVTPGNYFVSISFLGYQTFRKNVQVDKAPVELGKILLGVNTTVLKEVTIKGKVSPTTQSGDTTQFNASSFKTNPDANAEDLVQKMPGIRMQDGKVQAQGEDVKKVLIDGKPFYGDDPSAALRNLPAEMIDKIQVFDQASDQSQFTGFNDGNASKTINIVTKPNMRKGVFGRVQAGVGYEDKYQASGSVNIFNGNRRISILGQSNNVNRQNFTSEDILDVAGSSGGRGAGGGGRRPGGGGGQGGGSGDFLVPQTAGISTTHAAGLNYSDTWGKKILVTGSYFFNFSDNEVSRNSFRQYVLSRDSGQVYQESNLSFQKNMNNRLNLRLEYNIDSANSILMRPRLSFQWSQGNSTEFGQTRLLEDVLNETDNFFRSRLQGYSFFNDILFRHKFKKRGRTFSVNLTTNLSNNDGKNYQNAANRYYSGQLVLDTLNQVSNIDRSNNQWGANVSYTEPLSPKTQLQANYSISYQPNQSDKRTFNYAEEPGSYYGLDTLYSNTFANEYIRQQAGLGYRFQMAKLEGTAQVSFQDSRLSSNNEYPYAFEISRSFTNILPSLNLRHNFSRTKNLRFEYRTNTNAPGISQLQNVLANTNRIQLRTGNPDLKQNYQHQVVFRYSSTNPEKSNTFFSFLSGTYTQHYIANSTVFAERDTLIGDLFLQRGSQLTRPVNLNGQASVRSFLTYGLPLSFIKSNLNLNMSAGFSRTPGQINTSINYANSQNYGFGVVVSSNISEKLDFTVSSTTGLNFIRNTLQTNLNSRYISQSYRVKLDWIFWKGFVMQTEWNHQINSGLSAGYNQNFIFWNMSVGKKVFKKQNGEIKLTVFDMLKENNSIQRNTTETYIEDIASNVLQRYAMLTFTYTLRKYKKQVP